MPRITDLPVMLALNERNAWSSRLPPLWDGTLSLLSRVWVLPFLSSGVEPPECGEPTLPLDLTNKLRAGRGSFTAPKRPKSTPKNAGRD